MEDSPFERCRHSLHLDPSGLIHRVYREPSWLDRTACWPPWNETKGETLCGMPVQQETLVDGVGPTCMACVTAVDADAFEIELRSVKDAWQGACRTIVEMHEAATGRVGMGPVGGVVEDVREVRRQHDVLTVQLKVSENRCREMEAELRRLHDLLLSA